MINDDEVKSEREHYFPNRNKNRLKIIHFASTVHEKTSQREVAVLFFCFLWENNVK